MKLIRFKYILGALAICFINTQATIVTMVELAKNGIKRGPNSILLVGDVNFFNDHDYVGGLNNDDNYQFEEIANHLSVLRDALPETGIICESIESHAELHETESQFCNSALMKKILEYLAETNEDNYFVMKNTDAFSNTINYIFDNNFEKIIVFGSWKKLNFIKQELLQQDYIVLKEIVAKDHKFETVSLEQHNQLVWELKIDISHQLYTRALDILPLSASAFAIINASPIDLANAINTDSTENYESENSDINDMALDLFVCVIL